MSKYLKRVAAGLCGYCGRPTQGKACDTCLDARKLEKAARYRRRRESNLCVDCAVPTHDVRCESCAARLRIALSRYKLKEGLCTYGICASTVVPGKAYCQKHAVESIIRAKNRRTSRVAAGLCPCGRPRDVADEYLECSFCRKSARRSHRKSATESKRIVFSKYSNGTMVCACCGDGHQLFLTIDHINGGGSRHRREISRGHGSLPFYRWLIRNGLPDGYQILCYNCNYGKWANGGVCPHKANLPPGAASNTEQHETARIPGTHSIQGGSGL